MYIRLKQGPLAYAESEGITHLKDLLKFKQGL